MLVFLSFTPSPRPVCLSSTFFFSLQCKESVQKNACQVPLQLRFTEGFDAMNFCLASQQAKISQSPDIGPLQSTTVKKYNMTMKYSEDIQST